MAQQPAQHERPTTSATALIALDRDLVVAIEREPVDPATLVARSTGIKVSSLKTITAYEASAEHGGYLAVRIDERTADICDYMICDVLGGAQAAVQVAKRFGTGRVYLRAPDEAFPLPDFLSDPEDKTDGDDH